jgi:hypothetical protein
MPRELYFRSCGAPRVCTCTDHEQARFDAQAELRERLCNKITRPTSSLHRNEREKCGMAKKSKTYRRGDLWIASSLSFKKPRLQRDWKLQRGEAEGSNKYLQLADVALGLVPEKHKPERRKMKRSA